MQQTAGKKSRKIKITILVMVVLLGVAVSLAIAFFEKPTVTLKDISLKSIGIGRATMLVELKIANPNPVAITVKELQYTLWVQEKLIVSGVSSMPMQKIQAENFSEFRSLVELKSTDAAGMIFTERAIEELDYRLDVVTVVRVSGLDIPISVSLNGRIAPVRIPLWRLREIRPAAGELGTFELVFVIENPSHTDIPITGITGGLKYRDQMLIKVDRQRIVILPSRQTQELVIPVRLDAEAMALALLEVLSGKTRLKFDGRLEIAPVSLIRRDDSHSP